jgi:hypothetical protein
VRQGRSACGSVEVSAAPAFVRSEPAAGFHAVVWANRACGLRRPDGLLFAATFVRRKRLEFAPAGVSTDCRRRAHYLARRHVLPQPQRAEPRLRSPALASKRTIGSWSVGAAFQLGGKFGVGRSGGMPRTSLVSLTSEGRRTHPAWSCRTTEFPGSDRPWSRQRRGIPGTRGLQKYGFDLTGGTLVGVGVRQEEIVRRHAALMLFSLAIGRVSRKVCIGVLP